MTRQRTVIAARNAASSRAPHSFPAITSTPHRRSCCRTVFAAALMIGTLAAPNAWSADLAAPVQASSIAPDGNPDLYAAPIAEASQRFDIPAVWLRAVIQVESGGNPRAVSPKGAMGLMQIMPGTWTALRARYRLGADPFDPHDNIFAGAAYLRALLDRFGRGGFLAAYNAGPQRFEDYLAGRRPLNDETRRYLSKLAQMLPDLSISSIASRTSTADDWQAASLFVVASPTAPPPNIVPASPPSVGTSNAHNFALAPHANGLFVVVGTADRQ